MSVIYSEITELALNNNQSLTKYQGVIVELIEQSDINSTITP
jgi:hypothetical protein